MSVFEPDKHFISWCGICPASNRNSDRNKSARISKGGKYLKPLLIQCAYAAIRDTKNPYYAIKYKRIAKRRGKKKASIAIARMMLTSIYYILADETTWHPCDYENLYGTLQHKKIRDILLFSKDRVIRTKRKPSVLTVVFFSLLCFIKTAIHD